jgi:hypothetical protein
LDSNEVCAHVFAVRQGRLGFATVTLAAALLAAGAAALLQAHSRAGPTRLQQAVWSEERWPFPIDQWGTGQAFRCGGESCGTDLHLYLRAKIGFCRCATGVSDDDEIDRVGDTELLGSDYKPLAPGHVVEAGVLKGRARPFRVERAFRSPAPVLTIALANKCDAVVATLASDHDISPGQEQAAIDFLRGEAVQRWAELNTGSN